MKFLLVLALLAGCTASPEETEKPVETDKVQIFGLSFEPKEIRIKKGSTVTWTNRTDQFHNMVGDGWESPYINEGVKWSHTFDKVGVFDYYCAPHRTMGMTGKIIVE